MFISFVEYNEDNDTNDSGVNEGQLEATIDSVSYCADNSNASTALLNGIFNLTTIDKATGETITIISYDSVSGLIEGSFEFTAGDFLGTDYTIYSITNGNISVEF